MKTIVKAFLVAAALLAGSAPATAETTHATKRVIALHMDDYRPCAFFRLEGVGEADPVKPGAPWFAVPRTHPAFNEIFALLLTAKATNLPVTISTAGTSATSCNDFATVKFVFID